MKNAIQMTRSFNVDRFELFEYLSKPRLLEKWAYPDSMTLEIPLFEERKGGSYRYEHMSSSGVYVCTGTVVEYSPGRRLVQLDRSILDPAGNEIFKNIENSFELHEINGRTQLNLIVIGFTDRVSANECEKGWRQCLDRLEKLLDQDSQHFRMNDLDGTRSNMSI